MAGLQNRPARGQRGVALAQWAFPLCAYKKIKCLLACLSGNELDKALCGCRFEHFTEKTFTNTADFKKYLKKVREQGYAVDDQEYVIGHRCVGAPVFDYRGDAIASISASGTIKEISDEELPHIAEEVKKAAAALSSKMGYSS